MTNGNKIQNRLTLCWQLIGLSSLAIVGIAVFCASYSSGVIGLISSFVLTLLASALAFFYLKNDFFTFNKKKRTQDFIDHEISSVQQSSHLIFRDKTKLNAIEQIQLARIEKEALKLNFIKNIKWKKPLILLMSSLLFIGFSSLVKFDFTKQPTSISFSPQTQENTTADTTIVVKDTLVALSNFVATYHPPAYTNLKSKRSSETDLMVPVGSRIQWKLDFEGNVKEYGVLLGTSSQKVTGKNLSFTATENTFYQIYFSNQNDVPFFSSYYNIQVLPDQLPTIFTKDIPNFMEVAFNKKENLNINYEAIDDYGLEEIILQTTISSGAGEQVRFRDSTIVLSKGINQKEVRNQFNLPIKDLQLNPGEELYWQLKVRDNRPPQGQWNNGPMFTYAIADTVEMATFIGNDLGVDLLPEYFRSQRQIIIDSEKLIKEEALLASADFKEKSNGIAQDQKILRLRYGQFLGEEFESAAGGDFHHEPKTKTEVKAEEHVHSADCNHEEHNHEEHEGHNHNEHEEHNHNEHEGHNHNEHEGHNHNEHEGYKHNEHEGHNHNEHERHKHEDHEKHNEHEGHNHNEHEGHNHEEHTTQNHEGHDHSGHEGHKHNEQTAQSHKGHDHSGHEGHNHGEEADPDEPINPIAAYAHFHDSAEESTFFDESLKAKLRSALNEMWQSELYLRLGQPEKALPYQFKALKLIKEIQQENRIYATRVGIQLPKLKMEKRLTGELKGITPNNLDKNSDLNKQWEAMTDLFNQLSVEDKMTVSLKKNIQEAKNSLLQSINEGNAPILNLLAKLDVLLQTKEGDNISNKSTILNTLSLLLDHSSKPLKQKNKNATDLEVAFLKKIF